MIDIIFLMVISVCLAATCPGMCNGHGSCTMSGTCSCYKGYTYGDCSGKTCPFGKTYVEPSADPANTGTTTPSVNDIHSDLECSGKGNCNRNSGLCECYDGFEGSACQRLSCPNSCSGHGLCVPVKHLSLNSNDGYQNIYDYAKAAGNGNTPVEYGKVRYDADQSFACVCDSEYTGYDCSEKKCPSGYMATSSCAESSSKATVTIELDPNNTPGTACLAYLEYTDNNGKKWYSDKFCVSETSNTNPLGWTKALQRLPVGVIDPDTEVTCDNPNAACTKVTITFGNQQTGRKPEINIITKADLTNNKELYPGGDNPSGYHGMSTSDLDADAYTGTAKITYGGVKATECAGNGLCNSETGLCECFTGFYGIACTMTEDMM